MFAFLSLRVNSYGEINKASTAVLRMVRKAAFAKPDEHTPFFIKIIDRESKSMKDLRVMAGSNFHYDMPLLLTVLEMVLVQSVNLLVMT